MAIHPSSGRYASAKQIKDFHNTLPFEVLTRIVLAAPNQYFYRLDLMTGDDIKSVAAQIRAEHGDPTVLISNAGIGNNKAILELSAEEVQRVFRINIIAHFDLLREFLPSMIKSNHGHVVTTASLASFATQATNVDYACTKAATLALHEGLAQELRHVYRADRVRTS